MRGAAFEPLRAAQVRVQPLLQRLDRDAQLARHLRLDSGAIEVLGRAELGSHARGEPENVTADELGLNAVRGRRTTSAPRLGG